MKSQLQGSQVNGGYVRYSLGKAHHIVLAEKALGRALPKGVQVHHVDEDKKNNNPSNLVICPNQQYHMLLHKRRDALIATDNPDMRRRNFCKCWDIVENMYISKTGQHHRACINNYNQQRIRK